MRIDPAWSLRSADVAIGPSGIPSFFITASGETLEQCFMTISSSSSLPDDAALCCVPIRHTRRWWAEPNCNALKIMEKNEGMLEGADQSSFARAVSDQTG